MKPNDRIRKIFDEIVSHVERIEAADTSMTSFKTIFLEGLYDKALEMLKTAEEAAQLVEME